MDGSVTHAGEGIFAGQAVAAAIACAMGGASVDAIVDAALGVIPPDSWTSTGIQRAVNVGRKSPDIWSALEPLYQEIVCVSYFWSDIAPEAVALAFGILAASRGGFRDAVLGGVNVGRDTDTIAAIAGAIAGTREGMGALPGEWARRVLVSRGTCLSAVRGMNIQETADQLVALADRWDS
jgi:ADP-ribosylglycohydrolase